jgi:hypothetical protein
MFGELQIPTPLTQNSISNTMDTQQYQTMTGDHASQVFGVTRGAFTQRSAHSTAYKE